MARIPLDPPFTADDIPQLDEVHQAIDLGEEWLDSVQRANMLGHNMKESPVGRECDICWACTCHSKDYLQKPCQGLQLKKKEQS